MNTASTTIDSVRSRLLIDDPPGAPTREFMEFTLVYWDTHLKAARSGDKRNWQKHHIRRGLSSQLELLWKVHPTLRWFDNTGEIQNGHAKNFERGGVGFVPLVVEEFELFCELDITFLRPGIPGSIVFQGGDIDNRIKVLLDALRVPTNREEMPLQPGETNPPRIYCLLQDDKLITSLKVRTDQLLVPETGEPTEACLTIHVTVKAAGGVRTPYEFR